jgi:hypothetical protein
VTPGGRRVSKKTSKEIGFYDRLNVYARYLQRKLQLQDWFVKVIDEPCGPDDDADISITEGQKHAKMRVRSDFKDRTPEQQRHTMVHEIIHIHLAGMQDSAADLEQHVGSVVYNLFDKSFLRALEYAVDGLADAFAPLVRTMADLEKSGGEPEYE